MRNLILDTSFLSAYLNKQDVNHFKAIEIYEELQDQNTEELNLLITVNVVIELLVGVKKFMPSKVESVLEFINVVADRVIPVEMADLVNFAKFIVDSNHFITPIDFYILYAADSYAAEIITFDKRLMKLGNK